MYIYIYIYIYIYVYIYMYVYIYIYIYICYNDIGNIRFLFVLINFRFYMTRFSTVIQPNVKICYLTIFFFFIVSIRRNAAKGGV